MKKFLLKIALCATALLAVGGVATHRTFYIKGCTFDPSFSHTPIE